MFVRKQNHTNLAYSDQKGKREMHFLRHSSSEGPEGEVSGKGSEHSLSAMMLGYSPPETILEYSPPATPPAHSPRQKSPSINSPLQLVS